MVTACFGGRCSSACSKKSSPNSGTSLVSICASSAFASRFQSVPVGLLIISACVRFSAIAEDAPSMPDAALVTRDFVSRGLARRDDADHVHIALDVHHHTYDSRHPTECDPAVLTVVVALIQCGEHRMIEHVDGVSEVAAMLANVDLILSFIPLDTHAAPVLTFVHTL